MKGRYILAALGLVITGASVYYFRQIRHRVNKIAERRLQRRETQGEKHIRDVMRKSKLVS